MTFHIDPEGVINMLDALLSKLERRGISRADLKRDWKLPPNWVSYFRIALSGLPMILLLSAPDDIGARWVVFWLFIGLGASDGIDGWLARMNDRRWASEWGAFIDPIGDKLLVAFTLVGILAVFWDHPMGWLLCLLVWLILAREFVLTAQIRLSQAGITKPTFLGKMKTVAQIAMIVFWLLPLELLDGAFIAISMMVALIFTVLSWIEYHSEFVLKPKREALRKASTSTIENPSGESISP